MRLKSIIYFSFQSQILSENPLTSFEELTNSPTHGLSACTHESNFRSSSFQRSVLADRIIGGVLAAENEWPYITRLTVTQGSTNYLCSGTVVDNHWVLTAAHCCENSDSIKATFSDLNKKFTESNEYELTAKKYEIQPKYGNGYDLCMLNFEEDIIQTDPDRDVQMACLPDSAALHGKACWVAGWGAFKLGGKYSRKLRQAGVNVMSQEYCRQFSDIPEEHFYEDDICAGLPDRDGDGKTEGGVDACQGDSGGPLLCEVNGKATLVGVVSRGYGCAHEGYPGLYSSVYHSKDWIRKTVVGEEEELTTTPTSTTESTEPVFADITNLPMPELQTCTSDTNFPGNRIFGGKFANKNHWSFMARVKATKASIKRTCGGTIIENHWVLTSASCCEDMDSLQAMFNDVHRSKAEAGEFTMTADHFEIHPSYGQGFDLCLVKFEEDIVAKVQNSGAEIACLSETLPRHGSACWIAGWGRKDNGYFSWKLREATVNIFDRDYCKAFSNYNEFYEDDICAGAPDRDGNGLIDGGVDACDGDFGGPLICDFDGRATLVGVISRRNGCGLEGYPGIYSSIAHSYSWIQEVVGARKIEKPVDEEPESEFQSLSNIIVPNLQTCSHDQNFPEERFFSTDRIVGGSLAEENQWPYIVRLDVRWGSWASFTCGGTIIDNHWVVSAAHCCVGMRTIYGTFSDLKTNTNEENEYTLEADAFVVQPNYGNGNSGYDICMIHFNEDIIARDPDQDVKMACINDALPAHGSSCWVAGWGTTQFYGQLSDKLLQAGVNIMDMEYCVQNSHDMILFEDDICAGIPDRDLNGLIDGGIDACQGDSGGPLICAIDGKATLVGVVSRGYGCAGEGYPGLYSSIPHSYDWIQELVQNGPSSSAPSSSSSGSNDGRSQSSGPVTQCDSTTITISAHIDDLYGNLPEPLWDEVRLIVGTCNGTQKHESGWIVETFELGTCGGEISQNDDITFEWRVCGARSLISRDGVFIASKLGYDAKCVYPSTATVGTHVDVNIIKNCHQLHNDLLIEDDCVTPGNGSFSDLVQLNFYKDEAYQSEATDMNIGESVYGVISQNKTSSFNFSYQITKCTTYQNSNKTGTSYDLISSPCQDTDSTHFLELDVTDLTGKISDSEENASFHFNTFTFNENDDELHFECELKICIEDSETGAILDQTCIDTCS